MLPQLPKEELRPVCSACGKATFLLYTIRTGEPATAVKHAYCSLVCARLEFPGFAGHDSGR
jgi:hypothetical protein